MDLFKRGLAPIPEMAWEEINKTAQDVIETTLSARKVLHVEGPFGLQKTSVDFGTLTILDTQGKVKAGLYDLQPMVEARIGFELKRWELDNILRGKEDIELDALEDAAEALALYEEDALYNGNKQAGIQGLVQAAPHKLSMTDNANETLQAVAEGLLKMQDSYTTGPYVMVVGDDLFKKLHQVHDGKLLIDAIETLIEGKVIHSKVLKGALLLPFDHDDLRITIGQDYAIGYETHDHEKVKLFLMNSFTFRILNENRIVYFKYYQK